MASLTSCYVIGPPQNIQSSIDAGDYGVNYSVEIATTTGDGNLFSGPRSALALAQGAVSPFHAVPLRWRTYNYAGVLSSTERDDSSYCRDWILRPTNERRTNWLITAVFARLQPGEMPNIDADGKEILNPLQWYPRYQFRKFTIGEIVDGGWPRDPIAGEGQDGNLYTTRAYGPFSGPEGMVLDTDPHPLDDHKATRYLYPIGRTDARKKSPITKANLLSPVNFPRRNQEYALLQVRMNWASQDAFWLRDQQQRNTVWNGGDDWKANVEDADLTDDEGRHFWSCPWGKARYQGGSIVSEPTVVNGVGFYTGEFRYELFFDLDAGVRVRNDDVMDINGLQIITSGENTEDPSLATSPQWLNLEGTWLGNKTEDMNWIRWWDGGGFDYAKVTNGQVTSDGNGGTTPIQVGMFMVGEHYVSPPSFPYPVSPPRHAPIAT